MASQTTVLEKVVSLCKRRGFAYPAAEIYGGLNGIYDFGPLGVQLRSNLRTLWMRHMTNGPYEVVPLEGSLLGPEPVWKASGHVDNFSDPMVDCQQCKKRYRADEIDLEKSCLNCGNTCWTDVRQFNMMFKTHLGALEDSSTISYLRPETAQAIFINFKNVMTSSRMKIPFGIAQAGKAFRNEITPKQFLFRMREFEQMEMQFFCKKADAPRYFDEWKERRKSFHDGIGLRAKKRRFRDHAPDELAHYAQSATDIEYEFPFGWKELEGIHNRSDFDLSQHSSHAGKELAVFDEETKESYIPYIIECSVGLDRLFLALLCDAYREDDVDGESRVVLALSPKVAPITAAFFPLSKKHVEPMETIYRDMKSRGYSVAFDASGSIGKRYRRHDEIGTPLAFTYDFESSDDGAVTVRDRDTLKQERISIDAIERHIQHMLAV